jgi:cold-inducible RNA-binding protein
LLESEGPFKNKRVGVRRQIVSKLKKNRQSEILPCSPPHLVILSRRDPLNQNRLFVGNLSYQTADTDLQDYFSQAGAVTSVNLMFDKMTGKSREFAFIEFATPEDANKAVEQFHNKEFQGRALTVNIARPREEPGGGDGQRWRNGRGNGESRRERR